MNKGLSTAWEIFIVKLTGNRSTGILMKPMKYDWELNQARGFHFPQCFNGLSRQDVAPPIFRTQHLFGWMRWLLWAGRGRGMDAKGGSRV